MLRGILDKLDMDEVYISKAVMNLQMRKGLQAHPWKYPRCTVLHNWARTRFSLEDSSRKGVSYLIGCLSNSPRCSFSQLSTTKSMQTQTKGRKLKYHEKPDRESTIIASRQREFPSATKRGERRWEQKAGNLTEEQKPLLLVHLFWVLTYN